MQKMKARQLVAVAYRRFCVTSSALRDQMTVTTGVYDTDYSSYPIFLRLNCSLESLRFNIHGRGRVSIWETPHYEFWTSKSGVDVYREYIRRNYGSEQVESSVKRFKSLPNFMEGKPQLEVLLGRVQVPWTNWLLVVDGTHRAAWAAYQRVASVNVVLTDQ